MAELTPPLILIGDADVRLFRRLEDVAAAVEPIDALEIEFMLFDANGLVLKVDGEGARRTRWTAGGGQTIVTIPEPHQERPEILAGELRDYLVSAFGLADPGTDLRPLIELAEAKIGVRGAFGRRET